MIEAIRHVGELEYERLRENHGDILDIFMEDPSDGGKYDKVFFIKVTKEAEQYKYTGVEYRGFRVESLNKYLYRSGPGARGADVTPTAKLTVAEKTVPNKIIKAVKDGVDFAKKGFQQERDQLDKIHQALVVNEKQIVADVQSLKKSLGKEGSKVILSLLVCVGDQEKWVGDWEIFRHKFQADCEKLFAEKYSKKAVGKDQVCAVCLRKTEVFGFTSTFPFYTLDKPGYVAGGFRQQDAWKNYPVCFDCGAKLELGKKYLEKNFTKTFYSRPLLIVPKTLWEEDLEDVLLHLNARLNPRRVSSDEDKNKANALLSIGFAEDEIVESLAEMGQEVTYNLLFFEEKQSGAVFNIQLNIEDVLPSRLRYIYEHLNGETGVNNLGQFRRFPVGKKDITFKLTIGIFNELFPYKTHNRNFLEMIYSLITGKSIDSRFLLQMIMAKINQQFNKSDNAQDPKKFYDSFIAWRYYQLVIYLGRMGLLPDLFKNAGGEFPMALLAKYQRVDYISTEAMFEDFFGRQSGLYNHSAAKGCFMLGYLAQHLIGFQKRVLNRTPFKVKLRGLKLSERDVRGLVADLSAKFMDYEDAFKEPPNKFYPCSEELQLLSQYLQTAGTNWPLNLAEIGFFVAVGMNGKSLFYFGKEEKL